MLTAAALLLALAAAQFAPVTTDFDRHDDRAEAVAIQADGKVVVAGYSERKFTASYALSRYLPDGSLDPSFGGDGTVTADLGDFDGVEDVLVQPDGRIVGVGGATVGEDDRLGVVRVLPDGRLDASFGSGGTVKLADAHGYLCFDPFAVTLQPDGKLVIAGSSDCGGEGGLIAVSVVRLLPDGRPDASFDGDGQKRFDFGPCGFANAVAVQGDGKILVAGGDGGCSEDESPFRVARLNADGSFDRSFGRGGRQAVQLPVPYAWAEDMQLDAQGRILLAGPAGGETRRWRNRYTFGLARLTASGALDRSFGRGGVTVAPGHRRRATFANAAALLPDGRIAVVGTYAPGTRRSETRVAVYRHDGRLDRTFRRGGAGRIGFGGRRETAEDIAVDADGRLVAVGSTQRPRTTVDFGVTQVEIPDRE